MSQRVKARGHVSGAWTPTGTYEGPPGSGLRITMFVSDGGHEECADIEEAVGRSSKRRLTRITGLNCYVRALAWLDGYLAGRAAPPPVVQFARQQTKRKPKP